MGVLIDIDRHWWDVYDEIRRSTEEDLSLCFQLTITNRSFRRPLLPNLPPRCGAGARCVRVVEDE